MKGATYEREVGYIGFVRSNRFGGMFETIGEITIRDTGKINVAAATFAGKRKSGYRQRRQAGFTARRKRRFS
jgi:hypothetical protein